MADCFLMKNGGSGTSFTYGENLFSYEEFKEAITAHGIATHNGDIEWNDDNQSFTLTATYQDCYTSYQLCPQYSVNYSKMYEFSFDAEGDTGLSLIFLNGDTATNNQITIPATLNKKIFSPTIATTYITLRFGVTYANTSRTYSNIQLREVLSLGD